MLRYYAQQGFDPIFAHGFESGEAIESVNQDVPGTMFVQINAPTEGDNGFGTAFKFGDPLLHRHGRRPGDH